MGTFPAEVNSGNAVFCFSFYTVSKGPFQGICSATFFTFFAGDFFGLFVLNGPHA